MLVSHLVHSHNSESPYQFLKGFTSSPCYRLQSQGNLMGSFFFLFHLRIVPPCVNSNNGMLNKAGILKKKKKLIIILQEKKSSKGMESSMLI